MTVASKFKVFTSPSTVNVSKRNIDDFACTCGALACFFTPLSTSFMALFSVLAIVGWLAAGRSRAALTVVRSHLFITVALVLFGLMIVSILYSAAPASEALSTLKKYRELLLLPIFASLWMGRRRYGVLAENFFVAGCIVLLVISYAMAAGILPLERYGDSIVFHITHSFFMAVLGFWALHRFFEGGRFAYFWLAAAAGAVANLFFLAPGRTGMLVFFLLMALLLVQRCSARVVAGGLIGLALAGVTLYTVSDNFSKRLNQVVAEIEMYEPGGSKTSIGQRFDWWLVSVELIEERPLFGHGIGSFETVQGEKIEGTDITPTDNPHNEYLFITAQLGLLGGLLFAALITTQLWCARSLTPAKRRLMEGVVVAFFSGCLMNSFLFDSLQGHFWLFLSAALLSSGDKMGSE
jgi:O-antigen ligase